MCCLFSSGFVISIDLEHVLDAWNLFFEPHFHFLELRGSFRQQPHFLLF